MPRSAIHCDGDTMRRLLLFLWAASIVLMLGSFAVCVLTALRAFHWRWGARSYMEAAEYSREMSLSGGVLAFRCADGWPTPAPAPSWMETVSFDYNVNLGVFRFYRARETWYLGERPTGGLSAQQRLALPHFYYGRHGWDILFMNAAFVFLVPVILAALVASRSLLRARPK